MLQDKGKTLRDADTELMSACEHLAERFGSGARAAKALNLPVTTFSRYRQGRRRADEGRRGVVLNTARTLGWRGVGRPPASPDTARAPDGWEPDARALFRARAVAARIAGTTTRVEWNAYERTEEKIPA